MHHKKIIILQEWIMSDPVYEKTSSLYDRYVMQTYPKADIVFVRGQGSHVYDSAGNDYLDFAAGIAVCSLGHCHPAVTAAIREQAEKLVHVSNLYMNEVQPRLAQKLIEHGFDGTCFFCNSGAEANEGLIKLARKAGSEKGRFEIIAMNDSFHGRTLATLAATGRSKYRKGFAPDMPGFKFATFNDFESVKALVSDKTAAVLMEPVQGEGGIIPANPEFIRKVRELCNENDMLLLFDEVQCGMGRTGTFFAWQNYGVMPDALSMAKALGNGFPIGAVLASQKYSHILTPGTHASTFGGTALACAAACAVIDTYDRENILENVKVTSKFLMDKLNTMKEKYPQIQSVRGKGLMVGAVLTGPATPYCAALREKGMLALSAGENVLRLVPPLNVSMADCQRAIELIEEVFAEDAAKNK